MSSAAADSECDPCDAIPPCPSCSAHQQCQQLYPSDCHVCPSNVCVYRPEGTFPTAELVGGVVGAILAAIAVVLASYIVWRLLSRRQQPRSVHASERGESIVSISAPIPMDDITPGPRAHFYRPPAPTQEALGDPFEVPVRPAVGALWRISEGTETSAHAMLPMDTASERPSPDVPQDVVPNARRASEAERTGCGWDAAAGRSQVTSVTLSTACPRLVRSPIHV